MAEGPDPIEKGVEELGEEITCAVCHDHYQDPKVLPCCHYYCIECVRGMAARQNPFPCPQCRKPATLPDNDPAKLPTAYFVNRIKDVHGKMEKARGKVEARCEMCAGAKVVAFCRQCTEFICADCVKSHEKMKVFSGHRVVSLEELREGGAKHIPPTAAPPMKCEAHEEHLKMFCFDCNVLICRDCTVIDHAGHDFEFVKKSAGQCREKMSEGLQPLLKIQSDINTVVKRVGERKKAIREQGRDVSARIKTTFDYLRQLVSRHEEKLEKEVSDVVEQKLSTLTGQEKNLHLALAEVQSLSDFVIRNIESATDEELMSIHKQIESNVEEQCQKVTELDQEPAEETDVCDQISIANEVQLISAELVADPSKCVVEGPGLELAELQKTTHVTVHTALKDGHPCMTIQQVEAELRSLVDGSVIKIRGKSTGQGNYQLAYTPSVRGRHVLNITVNGRPITDSPFRVFVRVHPTQIGRVVGSIKIVKAPYAVAVTADEKLVVCIPDVHRVLVLSKNGEELNTIACDGRPTGVAVDDNGHIYVALFDTNCLCKFDQNGKKLKETESKLSCPGGVAIINNLVFVCNRSSHTIALFTRELEFIRKFGSEGSGDGQFSLSQFIAQDMEGKLWITDSNNSRICVFTFDGQFQRVVQKPADKGKLNCPFGIVCDSGFVYVSECDGHCVSVFTVSGNFVTSIRLGNSDPRGIATDQDGFLYICYDNREEVKVY